MNANNISSMNKINIIQLSIIIPVYNVEKYIRTCLESIYYQGLDDNCFEIILINDGTKDKSIDVVQDIIQRHNNIVIINQDNQGTSVARNNGIEIAKGSYILMIDPDDMLYKNSLMPLLNKAIKSQPDIVVADFTRMTEKEIENKLLPTTNQIAVYKDMTGKQFFLDHFSYAKSYVWCNLYRKDFLSKNKIKFIPGIIYEDQPYCHESSLKAQKCILSNIKLYIYRIRSGSAMDEPMNRKKAVSACIAITNTWKLTSQYKDDIAIVNKIQDHVYHYFTILICMLVHCDLNRKELNEIIDFLKSECPNINFGNNPKRRLLSFLYKKTPHSLLFIRYIYGKIFEDNIRPFYKHFLKIV